MSTQPRTRSLRSLMLRTTMTNLAVTAAAVLAWSAGTAVAGDQVVSGALSPETGATRVETMMEDRHCWTGPAPDGVPDPRHALVTLPGDRTRLVPARVGYRIWLEGRPGVLHGFCR